MRLPFFATLLLVTACAPRERTDRASAEPAATLSLAPASSGTTGPLEEHPPSIEAPRTGAEKVTDPSSREARESSNPDEPTTIAVSQDLGPSSAPRKAPAATSKDWSRAVVLPLAHKDSRCEARRWGDYVRVGCTGVFANLIEQLAGDPVGVSFGKEKTDKAYIDTQYVVFPLRRGDRRIIQLGSIEGGWRSPWTVTSSAMISAMWLDDEPGPEVVID